MLDNPAARRALEQVEQVEHMGVEQSRALRAGSSKSSIWGSSTSSRVEQVEQGSLVVTRANPNPRRRRKQATELPSARTPQPRKILRSLKLRSCFQCSIYKLTAMRCYSEVVDFTLPSRCHLRPDGCALRFHRVRWGRDNISSTWYLSPCIQLCTDLSGYD
jgi:hypothetical protein